MKKKKGKGKKKEREYSLKSSCSGAPPGNRTRVARMGILHDTTTPAALLARCLRSHCSIPTDTRCVWAVLQPWCCVSCFGVVRKPRRERCACRRPENRAAVSAGETEARPPEQRWLQGHGHAEARPHRSRRSGADAFPAPGVTAGAAPPPRADLRAPPRPKVTTRGAARCRLGRFAAAGGPLRSFPERKAPADSSHGPPDAGRGVMAPPQPRNTRCNAAGFAVPRLLPLRPPARRCASRCALCVSPGSCVRTFRVSHSRGPRPPVPALSSDLHIRPTCHHGRAPSVPHYVPRTPCDTASHERPLPRNPHNPAPPAVSHALTIPTRVSLPLRLPPTRAARSL